MSKDIALLIMTDGREDMIGRTLGSFQQAIGFDHISCIFVNDDSASVEYQNILQQFVLGPFVKQKAEVPPIFVWTVDQRSGFGGAIRNAWKHLAEARYNVFAPDFDWVFHLEDDFTFPMPVDLGGMRTVMEQNPYIAQMALRRQPWGSDAGFEGGFIEANPGSYTQATDGTYTWIETQRNWTTNPALYSADLCALGWPDDPHSEGKYGFVLKEKNPSTQFGIWGRLEDPPRCFHIGDYRMGTLY